MSHILVIDNYDSFVYTINGYLHQLGASSDVIRNDHLDANEVLERMSRYDGILVSPGPGAPKDAGVSIRVVREAVTQNKSLLGVCLGHQALAEAFGGTVSHAEELMHGKTSRVSHDASPLFAGVPQNFQATRYHSLAVERESVPDALRVSAWTEGGVVMGLSHNKAPVFGVQFHPESVLTQSGYRIIGNWLESTGLVGASSRASGLSPKLPGV
tara:strand:- start:1655 stop:2293 length:639 start_codon:yes stop_codon:yes gene_type:complete